MEMNGFLQYVQTGEMSEHFISDYTFLCKKIYSKWILPVEEDEFVAACLEKLCRKIEHFNPESGTIVNFLYNVIQWEARRLYQKYKRESSEDVDKISNPTYVASLQPSTDEYNLLLDIQAFATEALQKGIYIDVEQLAYRYHIGDSHPLVKVFIWRRNHGN